MKLFFRRSAAPPPSAPSFAAWVLHQVAQGRETASLPFNELEQVCSKSSSLVCGAVHADPAMFRDSTVLDPATQREAGLVARRTADGFKASLADRDNAILAWPWDHIATRVAWLGSQSGALSEAELGGQIERIAIAYSLVHGEQLGAAIDLWSRVVAALAQAQERPDLDFMGSEMWRAFRAVAA